MNKQDYLIELKAHNWSWAYGSSNTHQKGIRSENRLKALAATDPALEALYEAYRDYLFGRCEEPTATENSSTPAATVKATPAFKLSAIMKAAWSTARKASRRFGATPKAYIAGALRQAWATAKAEAIRDQAPTPHNQTVYFICIDESTGFNTRTINQPVINHAFTDRAAAQRALQILSCAFIKPFIKTSAHYRLH